MNAQTDRYVTIAGGDLAYVSEDGNYGTDSIVLFRPDTLTDDQWETLSNLSDSRKMNYITAILNNQPLDKFEEAYDG